MSEWASPIVLTLQLLAIAGLRRWSMAWTPLVLLANWLACEAVVYLTNDDYPVMFLMVADYASAMGVFVLRRSHWQSAIIAAFAIQLICHAAYSLSNMGVAPTYYSYWVVTYLEWLQIALVWGWIGHELVSAWLSLPSGGSVAQSMESSAREEVQ